MGELDLHEPDPGVRHEPEPAPKLGLVGFLVTGAANVVWAILGLIFWFPVLVRAALVSSVRIVHSALTRQPRGNLYARVRAASRFYLEGFWTAMDLEPKGTGRRHQLEARRFLGEIAWAGLFYLLVLRLLDVERFERVATFLMGLGLGAWNWLRSLVLTWVSRLPQSLPRLLDSGYAEWAIVAVLLLVAFLVGLALGRGGHRRAR